MKLQEQAIVAGPLPETARGQTRRASGLAQDASALPPPPHCCPNHRDTTQTETSGQSRSFKELHLPTKLALSRGPTCESGPVAETCADCLFYGTCLGFFAVSLPPQTFRWSSRRQGWAKKGIVETAARPREECGYEMFGRFNYKSNSCNPSVFVQRLYKYCICVLT